MNDVDTIVRETLEGYAAGITPDPDLPARAARRGSTLRHRRMAAAGALTVTMLGVGSFAAAAALGHQDQTVRVPRVQVGSRPSTDASPVATPSPSSRSAAGCPAGQASEVTETGAATASGNIDANQGALPATQAVLQSYLRAVANQRPISAYGTGVDAASHAGVLWVKFQSGSTVEIVPDSANTTWSAYPAAVAPCAFR